ncbi:hypothetical protein [Paenibacillus germinis]|nr:hypothetical protein [Paenibacillus germinis]
MSSDQIDWSPDGKKIYLSGWKSFDAQSKNSAMSRFQFIIEFK